MTLLFIEGVCSAPPARQPRPFHFIRCFIKCRLTVANSALLSSAQLCRRNRVGFRIGKHKREAREAREAPMHRNILELSGVANADDDRQTVSQNERKNTIVQRQFLRISRRALTTTPLDLRLSLESKSVSLARKFAGFPCATSTFHNAAFC